MTRENLFFPNTFYAAPLETWAAAIQRQSSEAKQCFLEQAVHYKALSDMEHEFLVVYASHPSGSKIVLGVDRNAQDLTIAASKRTSGSASQNTNTTQPSTVDKSSHLAYDGVQVSHDGTSAPILAQHGPSVPLYTITFSSSSPPLTAHHPSLLHLSILLLTIRTHFPSYALLEYQCYFFARVTCLALMDLFGGVGTELEEGQRAATWRGVHVSLYSAGRAALQNMLLLPLVEFPALIVPAGLFAVYSAVKLYDGNVVGGGVDRRRISDDKIRQHAIPNLYRVAWRSFVLERRKIAK
ncbi:hypothetical protein BGY98DRAFT_909310 [Russula aff. rugulosa BPL654]|nr:hypothetical protein BGY98DRAFT_909310 [Russula aff. rugulosa BPL654]